VVPPAFAFLFSKEGLGVRANGRFPSFLRRQSMTIPAKDQVKGISLSGWLPRTDRQLSEQLNRYLSSRNLWP
jgi:hypothetical protein